MVADGPVTATLDGGGWREGLRTPEGEACTDGLERRSGGFVVACRAAAALKVRGMCRRTAEPYTPPLTISYPIAMRRRGELACFAAGESVCEHTDKGALGLVINKPIDIKLKNLFEKVELSLDHKDLAEAPVISADRCRPSAASCCTSGSTARAATTAHAGDPGRRLR